MFWYRSHKSTVVALHPPLRLMVRQRDGAVLALERFAASATQDHRGISAAVEQHHSLLFSLKAQANLLNQLARNHLLMAGLLKLLPHVHQFNFREWTLLHPVRHFKQRIAVLFRVEI